MFITPRNLAATRGEKRRNREEIKEVVDTFLMSDRYHDENAVSNRSMAVDSSWLLLLDCQFRGVFHGILFSSLPLSFLFILPDTKSR